jgi:hypothetical protein
MALHWSSSKNVGFAALKLSLCYGDSSVVVAVTPGRTPQTQHNRAIILLMLSGFCLFMVLRELESRTSFKITALTSNAPLLTLIVWALAPFDTFLKVY